MSGALILVDGYSVIYAWPELRAKQRLRLAAARQELVRQLEQFADATGKAVTVVFDGRKAPPPVPMQEVARGIGVIFSRRGQTADDVIERRVATAKDPAAILVVTEDGVERRVCEGFGARVAGTEEMRALLDATAAEFGARLAAVRRQGRSPRRLQIRS